MSDNPVGSRKTPYLIAKPRQTTGQFNVDLLDGELEVLRETVVDGEVSLNALVEVLESGVLDIRLLDSISGDNEDQTVLVVEMDDRRAKLLDTAYQGRLLIEEDQDLEYCQLDDDLSFLAEASGGLVVLEDNELELNIRVQGEDGSSVASATVYVVGSLWLEKGVTDAAGEVTVTLFGETSQSLKRLIVKPSDSYWSLNIDRPELRAGDVNVATLRRLESHESVAEDFPESEILGWGQRAMGLHEAKRLSGEGVRVAVIDSGLQTTHVDFASRQAEGSDFTGNTPDTWTTDMVGHGTHVAGVVAAQCQESGPQAAGIRGFAPAAELFAFKIFPGGKFSSLIAALAACIERQIHVVNLSLGGKKHSSVLEQKVLDAYDAGVACIAAAGNNGGAVLFPAAFEKVFAVAAVGKFGTYPRDSGHAKQVGEHAEGGEYFAARFTCHGPEVNVAAPGVAVISSVPTAARGYAAWDGTSMACPHVAGLAALILQNHPNIASRTGAERVEALFEALSSCAEPLPGIASELQGRGLPNAVTALGQAEPSGGGTDALDELAQLLQRASEIVSTLQ